MNTFLVIILSLVLLEYLISQSIEFLNLKHQASELPEEFKDVLDPKKYAESLQYQAECTQFSFFEQTASLAAFLVFLVLEGFYQTDLFSKKLGLSYIPTALVFVGTLSILKSLLEIPFSAYKTFVIEEKFGFNKTNLKTFVSDRLKGLLLTAVIGAPVFATIILFFKKTGPESWAYVWAFVTAVQLFLSFIAPHVLLPIFNKFSPLPEGELRSQISSYSEKQKFQLSGIFTMDGSKRSTKANAFFTGFGRFKRIVLFDTLLVKHTTDEIVAVLAHEIGHYKNKHIVKAMGLSILTSGVLFYSISLLIHSRALSEAFGIVEPTVYANLVFIGILYSPVMRFLGVIPNMLSRRFEYEADRYATTTLKSTSVTADSLISALKKLSVDSLSNLTPHPLKVALDYSHPPVVARIRAMKTLL